jgi:hypothetical protein
VLHIIVKSKLTEAEKARRAKCKVKSMLIAFISISRGLFTKNSPWQAKHSIPHTTVTFHGDFVEMCEDFAPNFRD